MHRARLAIRYCAATLALCAPAGIAAEGLAPVTVEDPHYGEVLFHFYQGNYFDAIVTLTAAQQTERVSHHADEAELLRGGLFLSYGQHDEAARIFDALLASNTSPSIRDRTWFFLAKIRYQRGYPVAAADALGQIGAALPAELEPERRMLTAQVYIEQQRYAEAIALLRDWDGPPGWIDYARYNLGVALVRAGDVADGTRMLEGVGRLRDDREEMLGLRDKANVALGYTYLQQGEAAAAKPILQRVRLDGPFSNKALLGVGWADAEAGRFESALVPWTTLARRDLLDPAVQESLLAVPYAMGKLDAVRQAAEQYEQAIVAFAAEHDRIEATIADIDAGGMVDRLLSEDETGGMGWYWQLESMPDGVENRYLYHLMASHTFQEALKNYRDLRFLHRNLGEWRDKIGVFRQMLETRELGYAERLPRIERRIADTDLDALQRRHAALSARLDDIVARADAMALATPREKRLWAELDALQDHPALASSHPDAAAARDKFRLLRGVLQWEAERDFRARAWRQHKALRDTRRALVSASQHFHAVETAQRDEPARLIDFDARIAALAPRLERLQGQLADRLERQERFLRSLAVSELRAQQERLDTYTVQARFALAAVYDRATAARNTAPAGASK